jgi:hypothetical protein
LADGAWDYSISALSYYTPPETPDNDALLAGLRYIGGAEQISDQPYVDYVYRLGVVPPSGAQPSLTELIPASAAKEYLPKTLGRIYPEGGKESVFIELFAWKSESFHRPLFRIPEEATFFGAGILRVVVDEPAAIQNVLAENRSLYEENVGLGGTLYPFSGFVKTRADWVRHYGREWPRLVAAKKRYDPRNVFASGPDIF